MLKKRIIFQLLTDGRAFFLSRNFRTNRIGDFDWLLSNLQLSRLLEFVDEVALINFSQRSIQEIEAISLQVMSECFVPISITGGLASKPEIDKAMKLGFEKVGFNTALTSNPDLIRYAASRYGAQSVIAHVDVRDSADGRRTSYSSRGKDQIGLLADALKELISLPVGELVLHSISREGTGHGYDLGSLAFIPEELDVPVTISGGASRSSHLLEAVSNPLVTGMATADLLSFVRGGMEACRGEMLRRKAPIAAVIGYPEPWI